MFETVRRAVRDLDPDLPVFEFRPMEQRVERSLTNERVMAGLSTVLGVWPRCWPWSACMA